MRFVAFVLTPAAAGVAAALFLPWFEGGYGYFLVLALPAVAVTAANVAHRLRERGEVRYLETHSVAAAAVVAEVEPIRREVNDAFSHPVVLSFTDLGGHRRRIRHATGLGGYAVPEGTEVTVRLSTTDPDKFRVAEIAGLNGGYPVARYPGGPPLAGLAAALAVAVLALAAVVLEPVVLDSAWSSASDAVGGFWFILGSSYFLWLGLRKKCRLAVLPEQAEGTITKVWERTVGGADKKQLYAFTVHFSTPDGREIHSRYPEESYYPRHQGQRVGVRYSAAYPPRFEVPDKVDPFYLWIGGSIGVALLAMGIWTLTGG